MSDNTPLPPPPPVNHVPSAQVIENGGYSVEKETLSPTFILILNVVNTVTHLAIGATALSAFFFANIFSNSANSLKQHVYLCVTGYIVLMSQAILSLSPHTGWAKSFEIKQRRQIHWVMQIVGSVLAIAGSVVRIVDLGEFNIENFQTTHGILGLITMIFTIVTLFGGILNLNISKFSCLKIYIRILHSLLGALTLTLAFCCLCYGFSHDIFRIIMGETNTNISIAMAVMSLVGTLLAAVMRIFQRKN